MVFTSVEICGVEPHQVLRLQRSALPVELNLHSLDRYYAPVHGCASVPTLGGDSHFLTCAIYRQILSPHIHPIAIKSKRAHITI